MHCSPARLGYNVIEDARPIPAGARLDSVEFINHGGVVVLTRSGLQLRKINTLGNYATFEYVCGRVASSAVQITLIVVYRPGSVPPSAEFFDEIDAIVSRILLTSDVLLIVGDMNVRLDRPTDPHAVSLDEVLTSFQLHQHASAPTHSLGGTLDVVITREDCPLQDHSVVFVPFSDHLLVKWTLHMTKPDIVLRTTRSRN